MESKNSPAKNSRYKTSEIISDIVKFVISKDKVRFVGSLGIATLSFFVFSTAAFAQTATSTPPVPSNPAPARGEVVVLATVNVQNASITGQEESTLSISFDLSNRNSVQTDVKYGIELVRNTQDGQVVADEKIYDDALTLPSNSLVHKDITYTAPSMLSGTYTVFVTSKSASGFPFGVAPAGTVSLSASARGIEIIPDSCFLMVTGEKDGTQYTLPQGVDIAPSESLVLSCDAVNNSGTTISATPSYETFFRSAFGAVVPTIGGSTAPVSLAVGTSTFSLTLPKAEKPQAYDIKISLAPNGGAASNSVTVHYVIQGESATIQNLLLDKDAYQKGDTAVLTVNWSASADGFPGSRAGTTTPENLFLSTEMSDANGACTAPFRTALPQAAKTDVTLSVIKSCVNPDVALTLEDEKGNVLDQRNIAVTSLPAGKGGGSDTFLVAIVAIIAFLVLLSVLAFVRRVWKSKKLKQEPPLEN